MALIPIALFGLEVPPGDIMVPVGSEFPAIIRLTMAAIDPSEAPEADENGHIPAVPRATLKLVKSKMTDDDLDEEDDSYLEGLLNGEQSDEDDEEESDEEANGGPSDPAKSKKARQEAAIMKLIEAAQKDDSDDDMENAPNGTKSKKGKAKASDEDEEDSEEESDESEDLDLEQFVVCTLDTERNYQQTLDITIGENEKVFFTVSGTHSVSVTGNYMMPEHDHDDESDEDDEYDLPPGMEDVLDSEDELSDELDEIDGMERVKEIDTDEEDAPKLVKADSKKGKKRPAEDAAEGLDEMMAKDEAKLSKKQLKKLKNNKGEAVTAEEKKDKDTTPKSDKKVQFAKNLEQGPTPSAEKAKQADKTDSKKATVGVKVVQGVTIDDRKLGSGRTAKNGDKVSMRYIGKLTNGKVFDSNKKGTPFTFKIGKGEVIKGWDIGIAGMSVGGERRLTIPPQLAYGSRSMPEIPANSTLQFDVKLLEIK